jgi:cytochrome c
VEDLESIHPRGIRKNGEKIFKTKCAQCHVEKYGGHKQHEIKKEKGGGLSIAPNAFC